MNKGSDSLRGILDALTPQDDPLLWGQIYPIANNFDTVVLGSGDIIKSYKIVQWGLAAQAQELKQQFPKETGAIETYYSHIERAHEAIGCGNILKVLPLPLTRLLRVTGLHRLVVRDFQKYASKTVAEVINSVTDNDDLCAVMA